MTMGIVPERSVSGIYAAMVAIQKEVGAEGIAKTRTNDHFKFKFRGIDEVMNALNPILSKHGVFVIPRCVDRIATEVRSMKYDKAAGKAVEKVETNVAVKVDYLFQHADGSAISATVWGEATDAGDKATNKAMAAAMKYALFQTFCIPTEGHGDTDADAGPAPAPAPLARPRKTLETFPLVEDAMEALALCETQEQLAEWNARVKASVVSQSYTDADKDALRAAVKKRMEELK